jgi:hypothetical protein
VRGTRAWVWVCLTSGALLALACDDERGGTKPEPEDAGGGELDAGVVKLGSVQGLVTDTKGDGLEGVTVNVGGKMTTTDKDGLFDVADVPEGDVQVAVDDKALSAAQTTVEVKTEQKATVALTADDSVVVAMDDVEKGGTLTKDGVTVVLPANSLHKADGTVATGKGEMRFVVVAEPEKAKAAPGGMKAMAGDQSVQLAPDGMIDVRFYQGLEKLVFVGEADITFPLGPNKKQDGDEVTVWSFDENSGKWKEEGKGTVERVDPEQNGSVKTKAKHFTWWASAEPLADATCLNGTLQNQDTPVSGAVVEAISPDSLLYVQATSGDDGSFCLSAPQESALMVTAFGSAGDQLLTWTWHIGSGSEPASCGGACTTLPAQQPSPFQPGGGEPDASVPMDATVPEDGGTEMDATVADAGRDAAVVVTEICTNLVDDDQDDLVDCQDPDCPGTSPGCVGLFFHGDGAHVTTASTVGDAGTPSIVAESQQVAGTVEFWFRANYVFAGGDGGVGAFTAGLVDMDACSPNYIGLNGVRLVSGMYECDGIAYSQVIWDGPVLQGRWYHVARAWTADSHDLYIDGVLAVHGEHIAQATDTGGLNAVIGGRAYNGFDVYDVFQGDIDEVRIWNYARSAQQIEDAFRQSLAAQTGLIGYWPLNEGSGQATADVSGFNHHGELQSNPNWFTPAPIQTDF